MKRDRERKTHIYVPLRMKIRRLDFPTAINHSQDLVSTRDARPYMMIAIATGILVDAGSFCEVVLSLPKRIVSDSSVALVKDVANILE